MNWKTVVKEGMVGAWPICMGYFPIGLAFGVLACKAGLAPWQVGAMSLLVFAGSSQFIGVAMISSGAGAGAIIGTTFLVNLRHLLMSSALARRLEGAGLPFTALFGYGVTDESFAVNSARWEEGGWDPNRALVLNQTANFAWFVSTVLGSVVGDFIPQDAFGIGYALTAMFLCLLVYQLREKLHYVVAMVAAVLSVALHELLPKNGNVMAAAMIAATAGLFLRMKRGGEQE